MRTTVELKPEHRSQLLAIAARRGQKGFSDVLTEAIDAYLKGEAEREKRRQALRTLTGTLSSEDAERLRSDVTKMRSTWRC